MSLGWSRGREVHRGDEEDVGECLRFQIVIWKCKRTKVHVHSYTRILPLHFHKIWSSLFREGFAVPLQDHFIPTNSLLWWLNISPLQGINYWAVEHHKGAWLGAKAGEGACLPGWLAWRLLYWLRCRRQRSSRPRQSPAQLQRRAEKCCRDLAKGSPGYASKQLPPWLQCTIEFLRGSQNTPTPLRLSPSLTERRCCTETGSPNITTFP